MANDINRVILVGRLTRDPEIKSTSAGTVFARFTLASNRSYRAKEETREEAGFFDCIAWGKQAEIIGKYLSKGRRVAVDGSLRFSSWETDGKRNSKIEIQVENFQFLDPKGISTESGFSDGGASYNTIDQSAPDTGNSDMDDDIPF